MRKSLAALAFLICGTLSTAAAELKVMTVGLVGNSFTKLTAAWSQKTGNTVTLVLPPSALDMVLDAMKTKGADAVLLPMSEMPAQAAQFRPGTIRAIGRVLFGLGVKLNMPAPRITSEAAFKAALAGKTVLVNDPATSLNGRMAKAMLNGPGFETVTVHGIYSAAAELVRGNNGGDYVITVLPEEVNLAGLKLVGEVPPALGLKIDFGGGVTTKAAQPELARQFLDYLTSAEAVAVWRAGGVASPVP
ncbi:MAG: substrate-binding domain-containing protein [Alphaproteobacteria bacterium]|nr:substrate-binding domain-containing protein [Alphaproteobacteria bacterium]